MNEFSIWGGRVWGFVCERGGGGGPGGGGGGESGGGGGGGVTEDKYPLLYVKGSKLPTNHRDYEE